MIADSELRRIGRLASKMKRLGILNYKSGDMEITLSPQALVLVPRKRRKNLKLREAEEDDEQDQDSPEVVSEAQRLGMSVEEYKILTWNNPPV
jgi:hypothetical protein